MIGLTVVKTKDKYVITTTDCVHKFKEKSPNQNVFKDCFFTTPVSDYMRTYCPTMYDQWRDLSGK